LPHGAGFGAVTSANWGIPGSNGSVCVNSVVFSLAVLCWVSGFDIIYALQDEDFDRGENLHSIPAWLGKVNALRLSTFLHVLSAAFVMMPVFFTPVGFGYLYYAGSCFLCAMLNLSTPACKTKRPEPR